MNWVGAARSAIVQRFSRSIPRQVPILGLVRCELRKKDWAAQYGVANSFIMAARRLIAVVIGCLLGVIGLAEAQRVANIFVLRGGKHYAFRGVYATFGPSGRHLNGIRVFSCGLLNPCL